MDDGKQQAPAIEVRRLCKQFGQRVALQDLELTIRQGTFLALFGPNGAGKTTLIRILSQLVRPTSGDVLIFGQSLLEADASARKQLGVISHQTFLYPHLTARENLRFFGRLFHVPDLEPRIEELLTTLELLHRQDSLVRTFSRGMVQRLALARAILHRPRIVLLDEPFTGLDPHAAGLLTQLLRQLNDGERTLLMITHHLEQGLELADRIAIQASGRIVFEEERSKLTAEGLQARYLAVLEAEASRRGGEEAPW